MNFSPLTQFKNLWEYSKVNSKLDDSNAICLTTINSIGYPHSCYVELKSVTDSGFVFCTSLESRKAENLTLNKKCCFAIWWREIGYQIRVVGEAIQISETLADEIWRFRSLDAQVASVIFKQSQPWESSASFNEFFTEAKHNMKKPVPRPKNWGGFTVVPSSIEFLMFCENSVHLRESFEMRESKWHRQILQP